MRREQQEFITTLNALLPGLALDLPSEAEWEYACRAGTITPYSFGETIDRSQVNFESDGPLPVGSLPPNRWGLHEMHGNVWEWCADTWHDSYEGAPTNGSAWVHPDSDPGAAYRVIRGGSWFDVARSVRAACRRLINPSRRNDFIGFRCARVQAASTASGAEQVAAPADSASRPGAERGRPQEPTGDATLLRVSESVVCFAPRIGTMLIRSDREELTFRRFEQPTWASTIGRDFFGLFTEFTVPETDVVQRLRWIPPGRFWMGSLDDEVGRWSDEGPRQLVRLKDGFWLFDTPCTQALWQAVMGENPSQFKTPTRPVGRVSYNDVATFLTRLNGRIPGLGLLLPSEAQWEYACRAGTDTATYSGPMEILGKYNAPVLDAIAWYGGNSGRGFELDNGFETTGWREMQYDDTPAGTRPVGLKAANPWGLYDTLGNVWEWCADTWHQSYVGAPTDGSAWIDGDESAAKRVIRGGSWDCEARYVRAAYRNHDFTSDLLDLVGFRCARIQSVGGAQAIVEGREEQARRAERGEAVTTNRERRTLVDRLLGRRNRS